MTLHRIVSAVLVIQLCAAQAWACIRQNYDDPTQEPDYNCPGPDEESLVPSLSVSESVELLKGKPAPWDGILMDKNKVLTLGLRVKALRRLRYIERQHAAQKMAAEVTFAKSMMKADLDLRTAQRDSYKEQLEQTKKELLRATAWYRSWSFGLVIGIVLTVAGTSALVLVLK